MKKTLPNLTSRTQLSSIDVKVGLAVITYKRIPTLEKCLEFLDRNGWGGSNEHVIIIDEPYSKGYENVMSAHGMSADFLFAEVNGGVAKAKNRAFKELLSRGCDHVFIMEDDVTVTSKSTCHEYIEYAKRHNLHHLNYGLHGPKNIGKKFHYRSICYYPNYVGAFSYYSKEALLRVGLMDERFHNALEHVDHTWRIAEAGLTLPFWRFADHPRSAELLMDLDPTLINSVIRKSPGWDEQIKKAEEYWSEKHGRPVPRRPLGLRLQLSVRKRLIRFGLKQKT